MIAASLSLWALLAPAGEARGRPMAAPGLAKGGRAGSSALPMPISEHGPGRCPPPPPDASVPSQPPPHSQPRRGSVEERFVRAEGGDRAAGLRRLEETLRWREEEGMDTILQSSHPSYGLIKQHYPHCYHLRGRRGEPVYYERPAGLNLAALRAGGLGVQDLLRHYALVTEYCWGMLEQAQDGPASRSIYVLDLGGCRLRDLAGDVARFVLEAAALTSRHYPERSGTILVLNPPGWLHLAFRLVRPVVAEATLAKTRVVPGGGGGGRSWPRCGSGFRRRTFPPSTGVGACHWGRGQRRRGWRSSCGPTTAGAAGPGPEAQRVRGPGGRVRRRSAFPCLAHAWAKQEERHNFANF